jgi:hypothetical protein
MSLDTAQQMGLTDTAPSEFNHGEPCRLSSMPFGKIRDEFPATTKRALAYRVSLQCSNPLCRRPTAAPHTEPDKYNLLGEAAHITGARPGGPRFDPSLSNAQRSSITNGIWLCRFCARIIDTDEERFPPQVLRTWKQDAENVLLEQFHVGVQNIQSVNDYVLELPSELRRIVIPRFGFSFLAPERWKRWDPQNGDGAAFSHPDDTNIEIRSWAGYAILDPDIDSSVERLMDYQRQAGYFELLNISKATRSVMNFDPELSETPRQIAVRAVRLMYRAGPFSYLHVKTRVAGKEFDIRCQAQPERFAEFREMFVLLSNSLRVLGTTMAAHAGNEPSPQDLMN